MRKALACYLTLLAIAIGGPAYAQPSAKGAHPTDQHDLTLSGGDYEEMLTAVESWVSSQFDLPAIHEHPRIEFAPPAKITSLRFTDLLSDPKTQVEPNNRASSAQHDTIAIYYDATRTIYLPVGWTGGTLAELSVLVHEVVHHFQNVFGLKYECLQEREKLAYIAQDRWLAQFGHSLESDFHIDAFSQFVKTQCFY
jgi:hypothetical protein